MAIVIVVSRLHINGSLWSKWSVTTVHVFITWSGLTLAMAVAW